MHLWDSLGEIVSQSQISELCKCQTGSVPNSRFRNFHRLSPRMTRSPCLPPLGEITASPAVVGGLSPAPTFRTAGSAASTHTQSSNTSHIPPHRVSKQPQGTPFSRRTAPQENGEEMAVQVVRETRETKLREEVDFRM